MMLALKAARDALNLRPSPPGHFVFIGTAVEGYTNELGRRVRNEEIQNAVQQMQGANIIMRLGHGAYAVVDPFVREMWLERKAQLGG
jgi:hypothetical protein